MTKRSVSFEFETVLRFRPDKREEYTVDLNLVPEHVLAQVLVVGARTVLTNTYNSGGKDTPEADRLANVKRKVAAWNSGELNVKGEGRDSLAAEMKDAYIAEQVRAGKTAKQVEDAIKSTVTAVFGDKEKATFVRFLTAVAVIKFPDDGTDDERQQFVNEQVDKWADVVEATRAAKAEAPAAITAESLGF